MVIEITTFDATKYLVDWELDTNGEHMGPDDVAQFEDNLAAHCGCDPQVVNYYKDTDT